MKGETATTDESARQPLKIWRIQPLAPDVLGEVKAVWRQRSLIGFFARHALISVYSNTVLGIAWMIIRPLVIAIGATFVVGKVFGVSVDPIPLPLFILTGLAAWTLIRRGVLDVTRSVVRNKTLLQQIYVPPLLLSIAALSTCIFQFLVVLAVVLALAFYYGPIQGLFYVSVGLQTLALLPAIVLMLLAALALGCFTAILNVMARDTQLSLRYVLSGWMLLSPVLYPTEIIPEAYRWIIYMNPMTSIIELYRWALLGYGTLHIEFLGLAVLLILCALAGGIWVFARLQKRLFDYI